MRIEADKGMDFNTQDLMFILERKATATAGNFLWRVMSNILTKITTIPKGIKTAVAYLV